MATIDSAEAKKQLNRIDDILSDKHLLIGGLAVNYYYYIARKSKDIDLVCSDEVRTHIIRNLYPTNEWDIYDENRDDYRPGYHIKHKKNELIISFGPKITEREPYKDINWELLKEDSIQYKVNNNTLNNIYVPNAAALAYTKLISFISRQNKDLQDLQDFIDLTNHKSCSLDVLFNLIDRVANKAKLENDFWDKILSKTEYQKIIKRGNIFQFADFFSQKRGGNTNPGTLENKPMIFFSKTERPSEAQICKAIQETNRFYFMAKTGADFFSNYSQDITNAIDTGCCCKFLIVNKDSLAIEYGRCEANNLENIESAYFYLRQFKSYGKDKVEVRVLNYYPAFDFEYFEKKDDTKMIIVRINFLFSHLSSNRPLFMLQQGDNWYPIFLKNSSKYGKNRRYGEKQSALL